MTTDLRARRPLAFTNGVVTPATDTAKLCIWSHSGDGVRLLAIEPRHILEQSVLHILIDETKPFIVFRPGLGLLDGDPHDIVFGSTEPIDAKASLLITVSSAGRPVRLGTYNVQTQRLIAKSRALPWQLVYGFPLPPAVAASAGRQRECLALLANFKALKNDWPQLQPPSVVTEMNGETALPSVEHRQRVQGKRALSDDDRGSWFLEYGYKQLKIVLRIAEVYGARLTSGLTVLDWGVGCGRIARHMPPPLQPGFVGIDVDPTNVRWCQDHMPFGRYETIDPFGKTEFDDEAFDLIYGHSVLTHLSEQDQFHWLEELARISRGIMILSVSGLFAIQGSKWSRDPDKLARYLTHGFRNAAKASEAIQDVTPVGYYRSVSHTPAYILSRWTRFVDIIDIIPGGFGTRHDAVICRPRSPEPPVAVSDEESAQLVAE